MDRYGPKHRSNRNCYYLERHVDSILCCSVDHNMTMVVSGGVDDTAYVWNLQTGDVKFECKGHRDSVVCASFSLNSAQVATGDMGGFLQVRDTTTGNKIVSYDLDEIRWIKWHNKSPYVLLAGTTGGEFWMWHTHCGTAQKTFPSFHIPSIDGHLLEDGAHILVSYDDGSMRLFSLRSLAVIHHFRNSKFDNAEITCMDYSERTKVAALGFSNSKVQIIASQSFKLLKTMNCTTPHEEKLKIVQRQASEARELAENRLTDSCVRRRRTEASETQQATENDAMEPTPSTSTDIEMTTSTEPPTTTDVPMTDEPNDEPLEVIDEYEQSQADASDDYVDEEIGELVNEDEEEEIAESTGEQSPPHESSEQNVDTPLDPEDLAEAVETVSFSPDGEYLVAANTCGSTYIWQVSNQLERAHVHLDSGVCRATWANRLSCIVGCLDGTVRMFDINLKCLEVLHPHLEQILDICFREGLVVSASDDKRLAVFQYHAIS